MEKYDLENGIFSKIIRKEIPAEIVYQDEWVTVFKDIEPKAKVHVLIIPNKCIPTVNHIEIEDEFLIGKMYTAARQVADKLGIAQSGFRLIMNCLEDGGQEVFHIHLHLLGGEKIGPMRCR